MAASPAVSSVLLQDWYFNRMTTAERLALAVGIAHKYLVVYDVTLAKRYTWNGVIWVETEVFSSLLVNQIYNETPIGVINGVNSVFTLSNIYVASSTRVYLNGLRQKLSVDYTETSLTQITLSDPPSTGDTLIVDYNT